MAFSNREGFLKVVTIWGFHGDEEDSSRGLLGCDAM